MSEILTNCQKEGAKKIQKFLESDQRFFRLTGPPGSGKTFLIKHALRKHLKQEEDTGNLVVVGITLSHQAKNVLHKASIKNCRTFASAYGFKEKIFEDGSREFIPATSYEEKPIGHLNIPIFVHDEISQYSTEMKRIIFDKTSLFSKVILMGDKAQLPPIDPKMKPDEDSPMFFFEVPEWCEHELKERVRQKKGNPILDLSDIIREEIFGSQSLVRVIQEILKPKLYENKGYLVLENQDMFPEYAKSKNFLDNKIIAFRKFRVKQINDSVQRIVHPESLNRLNTYDLVFMTNNFKNEEFNYRLMNSDQYIIQDIKKVMYYAPHCDKEIECYFGQIQTNSYQSYIITPTQEGLEEYNKTLNKLKAYANQNKSLWPHVYAFTDSFCDFTMGYAINAYKCQGSTYKNVFIDLNDILETGPLTPKRKLQTIFTALTRATDICYFVKPPING
jgi:ATP-dependent exoDNAse (exonuclease V) alpha subunit